MSTSQKPSRQKSLHAAATWALSTPPPPAPTTSGLHVRHATRLTDGLSDGGRRRRGWESSSSGAAPGLSGALCGSTLLQKKDRDRKWSVDMREIRELRLGKGSRDFERYPEEARKLDSAHCFIVLYGLEFRLRTLSVAAFVRRKVNMWVTGRDWLMIDTQRAPAPQQVDSITVKDVKTLLLQVNYRVPNMRFLKDKLQEVEARSDLSYPNFAQLYRTLMFDRQRSIMSSSGAFLPSGEYPLLHSPTHRHAFLLLFICSINSS
ncbi:unnamed protein product [Pleuronectes platessa]|uniref:Uncharacterized protein n=1 Tax=Pleuronectes platessa TaxID=8262 RepID=A0A9N7UX23_PLEPL|nr:unnamed protein product [Pleuronectes platessa]